MRRYAALLLFLVVIPLFEGCGSAHNIETGMPKETAPPPDFDPGGDAVPDMKGSGTPKI